MGKVDSSTILAKIDSDADSTSRFTVIDKPIRGILMLVMMIMSVILEKQYEKAKRSGPCTVDPDATCPDAIDDTFNFFHQMSQMKNSMPSSQARNSQIPETFG